MDWARAKTILIVTFLILNIFLSATIIYTNKNSQAAEYNRYAIEYLNSRNIQIATDLKNTSEKARRILYTTREFNLSKLSQVVFGNQEVRKTSVEAIVYEKGNERIELTDDRLKITDQIDHGKKLFNNMDDFRKEVYSYLAKLGYKKRNLSLVSELESEDAKHLTFLIKYQGALLFDQEINISLSKDGILELFLPVKIVKKYTAPIEIITPYQLLVMANLPEGTIVSSVDFGYRQINEGELYATPVWRVVLDNNNHLYFNALTGGKLDG